VTELAGRAETGSSAGLGILAAASVSALVVNDSDRAGRPDVID
jgi:hypothetical protein